MDNPDYQLDVANETILAICHHCDWRNLTLVHDGQAHQAAKAHLEAAHPQQARAARDRDTRRQRQTTRRAAS